MSLDTCTPKIHFSNREKREEENKTNLTERAYSM